MTEVSTSAAPLLALPAQPGPCVIGATGGSGTRVVARIVRAGGLFIGDRLNDYQDAIGFGEYSDRWINDYLPERMAGHGAEPPQAGPMTADLARVVADHLAPLPADARAWGWKEPRSIYLVPFLKGRLPGLRFLHFVRDGRDMAFSDNQQQLRKHGKVVLRGARSWRRPVSSITLWSRINALAADYGESELGDDYLRVRFEDLCTDPAGTVEAIYGFFRLEGDVAAAAAEVRPPSTLGRWQSERASLVSRLTDAAGPTLRRFGYQ